MPELTVRHLADLCGARLEGDADLVVTGPANLLEAGPREISFLAHPKYERQLSQTAAGAVLLGRDVECSRRDIVFLRCDDPGRAFSRVVNAFADPVARPAPGIHPTAVVGTGTEIADTASIGPLCTVGDGVRIGPRAILLAGVAVGSSSSIGEETELHPCVVLYPRVSIGARCIVHSGTVIGADGFGYEATSSGWIKVPQCGTVVIEDDVEIGSGCTIDRGRFGPTRIGAGAKLDSQVHLGHNVEVGPRCLLVAQVGIAGSAHVGAGAVLGGQVGVGGHVSIGAGARIAGQSGVYGDIEGGRDYLGSPARPRMEELRRMAGTRRLPETLARLQELERRLAELEGRREA